MRSTLWWMEAGANSGIVPELYGRLLFDRNNIFTGRSGFVQASRTLSRYRKTKGSPRSRLPLAPTERCLDELFKVTLKWLDTGKKDHSDSSWRVSPGR